MIRIDQYHLLPSLLLLALFAPVLPATAQSPTQTPAPAPAQAPEPASNPTPSQVPPSTPPALPTETISGPPPTPEEVGDTMMAKLRYQAAIEAYKKGPRNSAALQNKLGIAYQMMLDPTDAMRCYQASLKLDPQNASVMNNLGTIFDSQKQYSAAERMYRKALKINPQSAVIEKNLATVLMAEHKFKKGAQAYQAALALDPAIFDNTSHPHVDNPSNSQDRGAMNYYMAKSCVRAGLIDRAIEYLRMALNEGYTNPKKIAADSEFASLRGIPAFEQLMASQGSP